MISIPIAVNNNFFKQQLDLFWFNHKKIYKESAESLVCPVVILQDKLNYSFSSDAPHTFVSDWSCYFLQNKYNGYLSPLNMQIGLKEVINNFDEETILELIDCDMFHIKKAPKFSIEDDEFIVCDVYENWHLKSNTTHKSIIEKFLKQNYFKYNGGFVPIIGKVKSFKKILNDWIFFHIEIFNSLENKELQWWAGMYSFQVACANNDIKMTALDICYIPGINSLTENHYISHYCCDSRFDKKKLFINSGEPDMQKFLQNPFYDAIRNWYNSRIDQKESSDVSLVRI